MPPQAASNHARRLANKFLVVANVETPDGGKAVVEGNQRVLRARLSDAKFFWDQDLKETLESRLEKLKPIVFHESWAASLNGSSASRRWRARLLGFAPPTSR